MLVAGGKKGAESMSKYNATGQRFFKWISLMDTPK
jgi:hypothetical protein